MKDFLDEYEEERFGKKKKARKGPSKELIEKFRKLWLPDSWALSFRPQESRNRQKRGPKPAQKHHEPG